MVINIFSEYMKLGAGDWNNRGLEDWNNRGLEILGGDEGMTYMTYLLSIYEIDIDFNIEKIIELPIENFDKNFDMVPHGRVNYIGVYILDFESGKRYIGLSTSPRRRINAHKKKINDKLIFITIFMVELKTHAKILEETLIRHLQPEYNIMFIEK